MRRPVRKPRRGAYSGSRINPKHFSAGQIKFYLLLLPLAAFMVIPVIMIVNRASCPWRIARLPAAHSSCFTLTISGRCFRCPPPLGC